MKSTKKKSFLSGIPSWGLAGIALVAPIFFTVVILILGDLLIGSRMDEDVADSIFYIILDLFIAVCCFYIIRHKPDSIWYIPILCNAIGIFAAIVEPNFWISSLWMFICGGWVLSIIASIIGFMVGRRSGAITPSHT